MRAFYLVRLALLPGIVIHELAHFYFCRMAGAEIHEVRFFSFGHPAGYVIHTAPRRFRAHILIALGPLVVNSLVAVVLFCAAIATWREMGRIDPLEWGTQIPLLALGLWLGLVCGLQALPSEGDAISLWQVAKWHFSHGNPSAILAYPLALTLRLANWLRGFWIDWAYAAILVWIAVRLTAR